VAVKALETVTRISLKNILYTTDFSPTAEAAAPYAWELAKRYGAKLIALHVRPVESNGMVPPEAWAAGVCFAPGIESGKVFGGISIRVQTKKRRISLS
jgi:nucleotide-binding universal stress UspA family protein